MIKIERAVIKEFRGVRELTIVPNGKSFVISGPNGSGKSGVVDAIEFALTGDISRLSGRGTAGLSVGVHGPHVSKRDDPAEAEVTLDLLVSSEGKAVSLTRNLKKPKQPAVNPKDPAILAILDEIATHPEITLSRRDIIRYVIIEPSERARQVQTLLKLDGVGQLRATLKTASNKAASAHSTAKNAQTTAIDSFRRHLDLEQLVADEVLVVVNRHRAILSLPPLDVWTLDTHVLQGAATEASFATFNKESALRDIASLMEEVANVEPKSAEPIHRVRTGLARLAAEPELLESIRHREFIEEGLIRVDNANCPLCDLEWPDIEALKAHLRQKLSKASEAEALETDLLNNATELAGTIAHLVSVIVAVAPLIRGEAFSQLLDQMTTWKDRLEELRTHLTSVDGLLGRESVLTGDWLGMPSGITEQLDALAAEVGAIPDQTAAANAQTFLALLQDRQDTYRRTRREAQMTEVTATRAQSAYKRYCEISENSLQSLYESVQDDFATLYRELKEGTKLSSRQSLRPRKVNLI